VLDSLEHARAVVPSPWSIEIANAVAAADVSRFLELLKGRSVQTDLQTAERALTDTLAIARRHNLSSYDSAYLELAMREGFALATLDDRLKQASAAAGVKLLQQTRHQR
jgi:predicted nucleic acid-binding protein